MKIQWHLETFNELTTKELWKIYNLRQQVFVVEQNSPYLDADQDDLTAYHLYATDEDDNIMAYSRFFKVEDQPATFGRVVIPQSVRGKGLGDELVKKTLAQINAVYGQVQIKIEAQFYAVKFYQRFGFEVTSEPFLDAGVKHVEMIRNEPSSMI